MGQTKSKWRNNQLAFYDSVTHETVRAFSPFYWADDFVTDAILKAAGVPGWTVKDTSAAGDTTPAQVADQSCGVHRLKLDAQAEEQESGLYFNDELELDLDKGPIIEFRISAAVLPTLLAELYFGLANNYVKGTLAAADQGPTVHACFMLDGSGAVTIHTDDASTDNDAVATGVTVVAGTFYVFRIDATNVADVKFYINGVGVGTGTTFVMSNGTNVMVQPYLMCYKSAGAGLGTLDIDYVKMWQATR